MSAVLRLLTSARFAITVIAFIILLSIAGTLLPNGSAIFSSPFFIALIALLSLSTLVCSLTKIRTVWDLVVHPRVDVTDQFFEALPLHSFIPGAELSDVSEHFKGYRCARSTTTDKATLFAQKGWIGRFGPHIAHFGILLLLLGVLTGLVNGSMNGYNNSIVVIPQGGSAEIAGFILKLNDFSINYYSDGSISEYKAMVSIIDATTVENYDITVNDPLMYKGLTFYLYDYDSVGVAQSGKASWVAFQIKSEAGVPFIWAGAFTTIAGIMVALYIPHKRIWIKESNGGLLLGGDSNKRSRSFLTDMEKIRRAAVGDFNHASSKIKRA